MKKFYFGIILGLCVLFFGCGGKSENKQTQNNAQATAQADASQADGLTATVFDVEDTSVGIVKRYSYKVQIPKGWTLERIKATGDKTIEVAKKETPFNALVIYFYAHPELEVQGQQLGRVEYLPGGSFANAAEIKTGDYKTFVKNELLKEPKWEYALEDDEVPVAVDFFDVKNFDKDEDTLVEELAGKYKITAVKVKEIATKFNLFSM